MEELVYDENGIIISHNGPDISGFAGLTQTQINNKIAESDLNLLRDARNKKLSITDWMANSDVTLSDEWKIYRQKLRDITKNYTSLTNVEWPVEPK
jgi:hypothetical protein